MHAHGVRCHSCSGAIPGDAVVRVGQNLYVTSPELTFVQLGQQLTTPELAQYAMELCGGYALAPWTAAGFLPRTPLSNMKRLNNFINENKSIRGGTQAREALHLAAAGSASPAETRLFLLLTLPRSLFGYGLVRPALNARLDIFPEAQRRLGVEYLVPDLLFPAHKQIVEYDSQQFHNEASKLDSDDDRREILASMGYGVSVVRARRLEDYRRFDSWVHYTLAPQLGIRLPPSDARFLRGTLNLRDDLRDDLILHRKPLVGQNPEP